MTRLLLAGLLAAVPALAAPVPDDPATDPAKFLPRRQYAPRGGTAVGVLVADANPVLAYNGQAVPSYNGLPSPVDAIAFAADGGSYNLLYVPVDDAPQVTDKAVRVGAKGDAVVVYPKVSVAGPKNTSGWGVREKFALVEVTVNGGKGAPADAEFVATGVKPLDGSKAYPLKVAECVAEARTAFAAHTAAVKADLDAAMENSRKAAVGDQKPTGPAVADELVHVSWLPDEGRLAVTFLASRSDGVWHTSTLGPSPADPKRNRVETVGTGFGIRYGRRYLFDKEGKLLRTATLAPAAYTYIRSPPSAAPGKE